MWYVQMVCHQVLQTWKDRTREENVFTQNEVPMWADISII